VYGHLPALLLLTSIVTCVILALTLRSPALAIKAVLLNLLSIGAALGFMVVFWQMGFGSDVAFDMEATGAIRAWIPVIVFASLFGISIDYEVFVLARIREEYDHSSSTSEAIVRGLTLTGRLVTCAALVLVITFITIAASPNQLVKIAATTLAAGVAIDALVVRLLLIPALVSLMGRWNWWPYIRPSMTRSS
jgi:RND superfamily putative drug exporter